MKNIKWLLGLLVLILGSAMAVSCGKNLPSGTGPTGPVTVVQVPPTPTITLSPTVTLSPTATFSPTLTGTTTFSSTPTLTGTPTPNYPFSSQFGGAGTGNGKLTWPYGVAVDSKNYIYVADYRNDLIQKFTPSGGFVNQFTVTSGPTALALDAYGNIYVLSKDPGGWLAVYNSTGTFLTQWDQFNESNGLAVDAQGYVYVGDTGDELLKKFTSNGTPVTQWAVPWPNGVAVDTNGDIYVASQTNQSVMKFSPDGALLGQCHGFTIPYGVAVDANHNVYATDETTKLVMKFDSNCNFITSWGGSGTGLGTFTQPEDLAVNSNGWVYVADSSTDLVQIFSPY